MKHLKKSTIRREKKTMSRVADGKCVETIVTTMNRWKNLMFVYLQIGNSIFKQVNIYLQNLIVAHYFFLNVIYWLILHSITLLLQFPCLITFEFCSNKSFNWEVFQGRKTISVCWCWRSDLILGCRPGLPRLVSTGKGFKF